MRISLERYHVIAVCKATALVVDKPFVVLCPRKHEAPPRQRAINYDIIDLKFLSGICHHKRWFAGDFGKRLFDIDLNIFCFRDYFKLPVEKVVLFN